MNRRPFRVLDAGHADLGIASRAGNAGSNDRGQRDKRENDRKNLFHDADLDGICQLKCTPSRKVAGE
jgi:hypothetical protein